MKMRLVLALAGVLLVPSISAFAQTAQVGQISGQIHDESGAVMPGVAVTLVSEERGFTRETVTDEQGKYMFPVVPLGTYTIRASLQGFETNVRTGNSVENEKTTSVPITLKIATRDVEVTVVGETPIVDKTNVAVQTHVRVEEFEKLPIGRNFQTLIGRAPGVVGVGNVSAHGALTSNNLFMFDGVNTTDPTTGTFGSNLNFEAIQEVAIFTSGVSAEHGRAVGAVVNVITKSGTNRFEGSAKYLATNDRWNTQNSTKSETTDDSLERERFDQVNPVYSFTGGGPIVRNRAWFFGTYERSSVLSPQRQTVGQIPEDFQQEVISPFWTARVTAQITPSHNVWVKFSDSPSKGFVIDYWGTSAERFALTSQSQTGSHWAAQYSGVFGSNLTGELMFADSKETITVEPFSVSPLFAGAPVFNLAESKWYNGATFDGAVSRPRRQANGAVTWFANLGRNSHSVKAGFDWQDMTSSNDFKFGGGNIRYFVHTLDQATRDLVPDRRQNFDSGASASDGSSWAFYVRDKFTVGSRVAMEAGLRFETQTGTSDVDAATVDTFTISPRLSGAYDLRGDGKSLIVGSAGRFYQGILQGFSDAFANVPQQVNHTLFRWDGADFVFADRIDASANTFQPNTAIDPTYTDEFTIGYQQQIGQTIGAGVRYIHRTWSNLIDDVWSFDGATAVRQVVNYDGAERTFRGIEFTLDKRFSNSWHAAGSYTYSRSEGNHFGDAFTTLGDFLDASCTISGDTAVGTIPCRDVTEGNKSGRSGNDRPHNVKLAGAYSRPVGPVNLTLGAVYDLVSHINYTRNRTANVLNPVTGVATTTRAYFYEPAGSNTLSGLNDQLDTSFEATFRPYRTSQIGLKAEVFNVLNNEEKIGVGSTVWCSESVTTAACNTARTNFGLASARGHFKAPRTFRFTAIFRF
jgi:hypothetical protein